MGGWSETIFVSNSTYVMLGGGGGVIFMYIYGIYQVKVELSCGCDRSKKKMGEYSSPLTSLQVYRLNGDPKQRHHSFYERSIPRFMSL